MGMTVVADLLIPFCEAGSLSHRDSSGVVRKRLLVSLTFVDTRALHDALFPSQHLDWQGVQDYLSETSSYTPREWMHLLDLLDFTNEIPPASGVAEQLASAFAGMSVKKPQQPLGPLDALRMCFARAKLSVEWDTLCKSLIMCNLADVDPQTGLGIVLHDRASERVSEMVRFLPAYRHTPSDYLQTFGRILYDDACMVRMPLVAQSFSQREKRLEDRRMQMIRSGQAFKRPSLTAMLAARASREVTTDESFAGFCHSSKIAANANHRVKQVAYYLACLPPHYEERSAQIARTVGGDPVVHETILKMPVARPDVRVLSDIVRRSHHAGAPFEALRAFREACVGSSCLIVTGGGQRAVHWSTVFRLYLVAYCRPDIWKELWNDVVTSSFADGMSLGLHSSVPEAEHSVQAFARAHPIALGDAVSLMLA